MANRAITLGGLIMKTEYTQAQLVALNTYLAFWPDGMTYDQVIARLESDEIWGDSPDGEADIDVLGDFQDLSGDDIAHLISSLHNYCLHVYGA